MNMKRIAVIAMAVVAASATMATAGTKYATNLVSNQQFYPETPPTLSPKSKIALSDKGIIQIALAGVVDGAGLPVTTSQVYNDSLKDMDTANEDLDGSEYFVIIKLYIPATSMVVPGGSVDVPVPVDLKAGKGKTKLNVSGLLGFLGASAGRGIEITGSEVWGPLTPAKEAGCEAVINGPFQASVPGGDTSCKGTGQIGMSGLYVPPPPAP